LRINSTTKILKIT